LIDPVIKTKINNAQTLLLINKETVNTDNASDILTNKIINDPTISTALAD